MTHRLLCLAVVLMVSAPIGSDYQANRFDIVSPPIVRPNRRLATQAVQYTTTDDVQPAQFKSLAKSSLLATPSEALDDDYIARDAGPAGEEESSHSKELDTDYHSGCPAAETQICDPIPEYLDQNPFKAGESCRREQPEHTPSETDSLATDISESEESHQDDDMYVESKIDAAAESELDYDELIKLEAIREKRAQRAARTVRKNPISSRRDLMQSTRVAKKRVAIDKLDSDRDVGTDMQDKRMSELKCAVKRFRQLPKSD